MPRVYCVAYGCLNSASSKPELSFFKLPADVERRSKWLRLISREDLMNKPPQNYTVCEDHFDAVDILPGTHRKKLKNSSLPSLHLPVLQKKEVQTNEAPTMYEIRTQTEENVTLSIKDSKNRTGSAASGVYKPNLWYFRLMTFLDKRNCIDSLVSEDEDDQYVTETSAKKRKQTDLNAIELHQQKLLDTAENLLKENNKESNPFGKYVGETLERVSPDQRDIAEKLISEVLFLARRNHLNYDSKIEAKPSDELLVSIKSEPFT